MSAARRFTSDADPAPGRDVRFRKIGRGFSGRPFRGLRHSIQNTEPAHIGHVALPKFVGINPAEVSELIDSLLGRERKG